MGGSDLCRKALWQWVFTAIEPKKRRLSNGIMDRLGEKLDQEKEQGRPVRLIRSRVSSKAGELLFKELVNEIIRLGVKLYFNPHGLSVSVGVKN